MYIAICDDDLGLLSYLKSKIYIYYNNCKIDAVIDTYSSGEKFLESAINYDLVIMDYQMQKLNGLDTAKQLRKRTKNSTCIIFLTSYPEIAIPAYSVDTYRFVVKSNGYQELFKALDDFRTSKKQNYIIKLQVSDETVELSTSDIVFLEAQNKTVTVYTSDGNTYTVRVKLSDFYKMLPESHYFRIHKSFIVNFDYILYQHKKDLKLRMLDVTLPISQNYINMFENKYLTYLRQML